MCPFASPSPAMLMSTTFPEPLEDKLFPLAAPPLAELEALFTVTATNALSPSTFELITFPSPVIVNPIVDPSASAVSPMSNVNAFESPVAVIFKVMFSQFVPLVLSQLKSTVLPFQIVKLLPDNVNC